MLKELHLVNWKSFRDTDINGHCRRRRDLLKRKVPERQLLKQGYQKSGILHNQPKVVYTFRGDITPSVRPVRFAISS